MIHEVTESLEAMLKQPGLPPPLGDAAIRFDRPTDPYSLDQTTVNLFLYEVRENLDLRSNEPVKRRVGGASFVDPPPYRAACTYLVTAWPVDGPDLPKQEHQLLSQVLQLLAGTPTIPPAFLTPNLLLQEPPLPMVVVQPDGIRNPAEFWAAIGNRLKPSLLLEVTVSLEVFATAEFPAVRTSEIRMLSVPEGAPLDAAIFNPDSSSGVIIATKKDPPQGPRSELEKRGARVLATTGSEQVDLPVPGRKAVRMYSSRYHNNCKILHYLGLQPNRSKQKPLNEHY